MVRPRTPNSLRIELHPRPVRSRDPCSFFFGPTNVREAIPGFGRQERDTILNKGGINHKERTRSRDNLSIKEVDNEMKRKEMGIRKRSISDKSQASPSELATLLRQYSWSLPAANQRLHVSHHLLSNTLPRTAITHVTVVASTPKPRNWCPSIRVTPRI